MQSSNQHLIPKSDAYEKALDGIDLSMKQNSSLVENTNELYEQFQQDQKSKSKFVSTGLWRKKRDIGLNKTSHLSRPMN